MDSAASRVGRPTVTEPQQPPRGVNPSDAATVLKAILDVWDVAADRMLATVARRLAQGITEQGWAEKKARQTLAVRDELDGIGSRLHEQTPTMVTRALDQAYDMGRSLGSVDETGPVPLGSRPSVVQRLAERFVTQLHGAHVPVIRAHQDLFQRATTETEMLMQTGTMVRRDAIAQTVDQLVTEGRDRFTDDAGRSWHLDTYARMAGRTIAGQTAVQGQLDEMREEGRDIVLVSDSPRECPLCRPWEQRLLSISGTSMGEQHDGREVAALVETAVAAGFQHPNCTHRLDPFIPGLTDIDPADSNPKGYEQQQELRRLERRARGLKRRKTAADEFGDTPTSRKLNQKIKANSARIKQHTADSGQLRRRDREVPASP